MPGHRARRWLLLVCLVLLAAAPARSPAQVPRPMPPLPRMPGMNSGNPLPGTMPGLNPPQMPGMGGPLFKNVWTCGKCGREIGDGAFPPAQCPSLRGAPHQRHRAGRPEIRRR